MRTHIGLGFIMFLGTACSADAFTSGGDAGGNNEEGGIPVTGGGGPDGGSEAAVPPGCDATKLPNADVCVVNDAEGIFVSSSLGSSTGDGSRAHPVVSLDAALSTAKAAHKRVYACAETYSEQIHLQEGVSVFGYFTCSQAWVIGQAHAVVKAPASPAAVASNIVLATRVEAVDIVSPDFVDKSQSSIALIASGSPGLTVTHATIHAGTGGKGDDGVDGIQLTDSGTAKNGGNTRADGAGTSMDWLADIYANPPAYGTNACLGESGHVPGPGGAGGNGGAFQSQNFNGWNWISDGQMASAGSPTAPTTQTAQGGALGGYAGASGSPGADGVDGVPGVAIGALSVAGYTAAGGSAGTSGAPGQGGGGSGGNALTYLDYSPASYQGLYGWGEAGPSGGAGGCPGLAGSPGAGGGASIAVLAIQSAMTFDTVKIESSVGGIGGSAGLGSVPTSGGTGGAPVLHTTGAGNGGAGGHSGVSGNGTGGPSIGIAWQGANPQLLASTVAQGAGGSGVGARTGNDGKTVPASQDGLSAANYAF